MISLDSPAVRRTIWSARFGLEREALRVTADGRMAKTPHPFPPDHPRIVRDFCENQTEINTGVSSSAVGAVEELERLEKGEYPPCGRSRCLRQSVSAARGALGLSEDS